MSILILTHEAKEDAKALLPGVDLQEISRMVRSAAPITHDRGNRRYKDLVFRVVQNQIVGVSPLKGPKPEKANPACDACHGSGKLVFYDECLQCHGEGCKNCDEGEAKVERKCPVCFPQKAHKKK